MRIVIDTNVLVSAALSIYSNRTNSPSVALFSKIAQRDVVAVASAATLYELAGKLSNPMFGLPSSFVLDFTELLVGAVEIVSIRGLDMGCRDENDNMVIETAYNGRVDVLVTRDADLQDAKTRYTLSKRCCQVLSVTEFLAYFRAVVAEDPRSVL